MATTTRHDGLSADNRSAIRTTILDAREAIEDDQCRQLERYGISPDESMALSDLGHLSDEQRETRRQVDAALEREQEATEDRKRSYQNYVREATKTHLNRLVALKALEARGIVTETLTTQPQYGGRSYMHYTVEEVAGGLCEGADSGQGVALDLAYQEISAEIRLFEDSEYTAIAPDYMVRADVIESLNDLGEDVWASDEAIGWVYQYFGEREREEIDERIDEENYKVQDTDIATKTQLFTPRYIVEWMVDNSLGRLWLEMYGDRTNIDDEEQCFYLAPLEESLIDREPKNVRDITVLDPACGGGHMLFYAFDVLYEMYLEQADVPEAQIPKEILKHNLYGIDIDPGAAQLAALSLYAKAKEREPEVEIEQINVISADAVLVNGEKKQEVLDRVDTELEERVLEQVWRSFENIREWGSLVRIEERIEEIIEEEREALDELQANGQARFTGEGEMTTQSAFMSGGEEISWEALKARLLERVRELAAEALEEDDTVQEMFAGEVEKSVELLDYFVGDYDVVVSNPPYLGSGKMGSDLKKHIKDNYLGTQDAFAAFIQRCWEFAGKDMYATLVTPENYMFIYSYRKLRKKIVSNRQFISGIHLSRYGFDQQKDAYTIPFVLRNRDPSHFESSRFYRMTHEQEEYATYEDKISGLNNIIESNRKNESNPDRYTVNQNSFADIGRSPFLYWFGQELLQLFSDNQNLGERADVVRGMGTGDDDRFIRKWWEINREWLSDKYVLFQKSGSDSMYYDIPNDYVLWENDGLEIKSQNTSYVQNEGHYFKEGVTYRGFGNLFTARYHSPEAIFGDKSIFVDTDDISNEVLIAFMTSSLSRYIMNGINPSVNFQAGDGKRLPIKHPISSEENLEKSVVEGIEIRREQSALQENSRDFDPNMVGSYFSDGIAKFIKFEDLMSSDLSVTHGNIDSIIFEEYGISDEKQKEIYEDTTSNLAEYPHFANVGDLDTNEYEINTEVKTKQLPASKYDDLIAEIDDRAGDDLREISEALEVSPYTVAMVCHEHDLYTRDEKREAAGRLLSYYLGCIMGRWDLDGLTPDEDGIVVFDEGFEDNVSALVRECIELTYGEDELYERETEIEEMLSKSYTDWLRETFFRYHHCKEYRRRGQRIPIYWQLESGDGAFSCFLYYHAMDEDTLAKLRGQYLDVKIGRTENRLSTIEGQLPDAEGDRERELRREQEELTDELADLEDFGERLDILIDEGFAPDFEAGIWQNIQRVDEHDLLAVPLEKL